MVLINNNDSVVVSICLIHGDGLNVGAEPIWLLFTVVGKTVLRVDQGFVS